MKALCGGLRFDLATCRRSDIAHFEFYSSLPKSVLSPELLDELLQRYPWRSEAVDVVLVMSQAKRARLALRLNAAQARGRQVVRVEASEELRQGQTVAPHPFIPGSYTPLRAHDTKANSFFRLLF